MDQTSNLDPGLKRFREYVAAGIAVVVVVGNVILIVMSLGYIGNETSFSQAKDLLLIINPMLGVVLGYYFNKVSTEARAENAEATAQQAVTTAQQAENARNEAQVQAQETKTVLKDVTQAAEKMLAHASPEAEVRAFGIKSVPAESAEQVRQELAMACQRARPLIQ